MVLFREKKDVKKAATSHEAFRVEVPEEKDVKKAAILISQKALRVEVPEMKDVKKKVTSQKQ